MKAVVEHRPATQQEMSALLGAPPLNTYTDKKGTYCVWHAYERSSSGGDQSANVDCLVDKKGNILKVYMDYFSLPFEKGLGEHVKIGDQELKDSSQHPGCLQAWLRKPFREQAVQRGFAMGKEAAFSPSGATVVYLPAGAQLLEWVGETPNIRYASSQPKPQPQPNDVAVQPQPQPSYVAKQPQQPSYAAVQPQQPSYAAVQPQQPSYVAEQPSSVQQPVQQEYRPNVIERTRDTLNTVNDTINTFNSVRDAFRTLF